MKIVAGVKLKTKKPPTAPAKARPTAAPGHICFTMQNQLANAPSRHEAWPRTQRVARHPVSHMFLAREVRMPPKAPRPETGSEQESKKPTWQGRATDFARVRSRPEEFRQACACV